ncbi:MAG: tyrosine--tRNA ligase [Rickettsiaceae bacterium]|nr:tyrosine--tRNA ligase [Rickettsiaceae bacterium]
MGFIEDFIKRGYHYQCSDLEKLREISNGRKISAYIGFDCTAKSLHVGNLMQIMILRLLQQHGHKPIVIIGGATTKLGDPTGKDEMRKILSEEELEANKAGIKKSLSKFIKFGEGKSDAIMLDNSTWLDSIGYMEFLRDFGRMISVNRMLTMEAAKARLERNHSLSFLEFNYMLLQAYDFCHLNKHHDCILQIGGSDQWGNIIMGVELAHKTSGKEVFAITTPLLTTSSGVKMGKSVNGAVWVNDEMLSPYDYFQFWRNTEDPDVLRFAKLYSEWSDDELSAFEGVIASNINNAKKDLAHRLTLLCHGKEAADNAMETARKVFEEGGVGGELPIFEISENDLSGGIAIADLLFASGLSASKSEAKKLVRGGGGYVNGEKVLDENRIVTLTDIKEGYIKISSGKKNHMLVKSYGVSEREQE